MSLMSSGGESREVFRGVNRFAGGMLGIVFARSGMSPAEFLVITGMIVGTVYLIYEYIIKPILSVIAYFEQFYNVVIPPGLAFPSIPAFLVLMIMTIIASFSVWLMSFFNRFPNYASRALIGFSIGMFAIFKLLEPMFTRTEYFNVFGPMRLGFTNSNLFIALVLIFSFSLLGWIYFASSRFFRFRSKRLNEESRAMYYDPEQVELEKVTATAFLNRRLNKCFIFLLLILALFDDHLWPNLPIDTSFLTQYFPAYQPAANENFANSDASLSVILQTIATYLFIAYFVITLQLRSARKLKISKIYAAYIPPHYVYFLAIIGTYCAAVFAFVPYDYMEQKDYIRQAIPPLLYFSISLFRTGRQYYRCLKNMGSTGRVSGRDVNFNMKLFLAFMAVLIMSIISVHSLLSNGINASFKNDEIRTMLNKQLPEKYIFHSNTYLRGYLQFKFLEVTEFTMLPNNPNPDAHFEDSFKTKFEMKVLMTARFEDYNGRNFKKAFIKLKGNVQFEKPRYVLSLSDIEVVDIDLDYLNRINQINMEKIKEDDRLKQSIKKPFSSMKIVYLPEVITPLINRAKVANNDLTVEFKIE